MDQQRWNEVTAILAAAIGIDDPTKRFEFVEQNCSDPSLQAEVKSLLAAYSDSEHLEQPALGGAPEIAAVGQMAGPYRILSEIGRGGMGVVYRAEDTRLHREVALKFLLDEHARNPAIVERFHREARIASALNHPNICAVFDIGEQNGRHYIVMELLQGQSLSQRITSGAVPLDQVLEWGVQIADALEAAHSVGIIHRDIKPANIFITRLNQAKVLDFGIAKPPAQAWFSERRPKDAATTLPGIVVGTLAYMAPEQQTGDKVDARTDVFGLGVVLFEMSTGRRLIDFDQSSHSSTKPAMPAVDPALPPRFDEVIKKAVQKDAAGRYQTAAELREDLKHLLRLVQTGEKADSRIRSPGASAWRVRRLLPLAACLVLLAGAAVWWFVASHPAIPFAARDWILVTDFENQTGDSLFDKSLVTAFMVSLDQSRRVNVYPRARLRETLLRMKRPPGSTIDESIGREIAQREGIRAVVVPSITGVGDQYRLASRILDPAVPNDLRTIVMAITGKDKILDTLDRLAAQVRRDLGESVLAISRSNRPLPTVTTASLDALRLYALGVERHQTARLAEAKLYYQNALKADPGFTAALASMAIINFYHYDKEEARRQLTQAVERVDSLTDKEKYGILAFYAKTVERNLDKAINYERTRIALYPDFATSHNNLGLFYQDRGRCREAASEFQEALRIDEHFTLAAVNLVINFIMCLGDLDGAIEQCKIRLSKGNRNSAELGWMAYAYMGKDSTDDAERAYRSALDLDPSQIVHRYNLALALLKARRTQGVIEVANWILRDDKTQCEAYYDLGLAHSLEGDKTAAHKEWRRAEECLRGHLRLRPWLTKARLDLAITLIRLGDRKQADAVFQEANASVTGKGLQPIDPDLYFHTARYSAVLGLPDEAMRRLELAEQHEFKDYVWAKNNPDLETLAGDPRFAALIQRHLHGK